jgi:hypothetical protein
MCAFFPLLRDCTSELRQWTIRKISSASEKDRVPSPAPFPPVANRVFEISLEGLSKTPRSQFSFGNELFTLEPDSSGTPCLDFQPGWKDFKADFCHRDELSPESLTRIDDDPFIRFL